MWEYVFHIEERQKNQIHSVIKMVILVIYGGYTH